MYRVISFIVIFSFVSVLLYFHNQNGHFQASEHKDTHGHERIDIPSDVQAPSIAGSVKQDPSGSWLLHVRVENFTFAPEKAGSSGTGYYEGHAHIYLNGKKVNRLYGNYYHLGELEKGIYEIKVTLNANNHGVLFAGGKEIAYSTVIEVE